MRVFVAGGAGFIGSHAVERLLRMPEVERVTVFDNFSSGQYHHLPGGQLRLHIVRGEIADLLNLGAAMQGHDVVFHFASNPDIAKAVNDPAIDFWQGTFLTHNIAEAMRSAGVRQVLYASGSGVYGDYGRQLLQEDHRPMLPISTYGASKLAGEAILCAYAHLFGIRTWIFRFGNVVGARQTHGVLFDFIRKLKANPKCLSILGDGEQTKSYIYVDDALDAVWLAWRKATDRFNYFNVASDDSTTVTEVAGIACNALGLSEVELQYENEKRGWPGDVAFIRLNSSKIKSLGWRARCGSLQALEQAAAALRNLDLPLISSL